ncbi:hypothetical protein OQJ26_13850 [Legionella sp. PATHC038]|nr:hypothetical protein [Legionella sp. PATHC038]MCW8399872.1 hypothetical protein [Legionella sp. PATHC038]
MGLFLLLAIEHGRLLNYWFMMRLALGFARNALAKAVLHGGQEGQVIQKVRSSDLIILLAQGNQTLRNG